MSADEAFRPFLSVYPPLLPYRDASYGVSTFNVTVLDCLRGLAKARDFGWVDLQRFDVEEYETYEKVENGDWNWIVPGKFIAFSSPAARAQAQTDDSCRAFTPEEYVNMFKPRGVTTVIRLNKKTYDSRKFTEQGLEHYDLIYPDGSTPSDIILKNFLDACEATSGSVAIHCKAGLGRTGTLIGCYIMKHFRMSASECIGYLRLQRPGMVIGPQQHYLRDVQQRLWKQGDVYRKHSPTKLQHLGTSIPNQAMLKLLSPSANNGAGNQKSRKPQPSAYRTDANGKAYAQTHARSVAVTYAVETMLKTNQAAHQARINARNATMTAAAAPAEAATVVAAPSTNNVDREPQKRSHSHTRRSPSPQPLSNPIASAASAPKTSSLSSYTHTEIAIWTQQLQQRPNRSLIFPDGILAGQSSAIRCISETPVTRPLTSQSMHDWTTRSLTPELSISIGMNKRQA